MKNILISEDNRDLSNTLFRALTRFNFKVDVAFDGVQALDKLTNNKYDCVILDVMIPRINGFDVCKNMRVKGDHTPVLMLTAKAEDEDRAEGLAVGANIYMTKPFSLKELVDNIKELIEG